MPCGGISPVSMSIVRSVATVGTCWQCGRGNAYHFIEEWDDFIHARCAPTFLLTPEGEVIMSHGHTVILDFNIEGEPR